ncbi:LLM class flavin-dependent oxidoreductase [Actinoplanes sp. TRM 88003]|uniref:LLM class flavin-dependent oxidoreductase n=1 Tax=Paractinoplanes aksuensis TaxID=2939490 RepID=A0ABT1DQU9_9ACTN|nr:LLM class flavin-dependent oxidoreductase [Actinoplanes aksuensis]MCO8273217.1 LLM class flavin-dependent oxidoreductase [Actinoplanes aksuensis]
MIHTALELGSLDVTAVEAAGFAFVTIANDGPVEAGVLAAHLSRRTQRIGLAPELHVTVTEPFHLATQLASLDHASLGRAGWVVGAVNTVPAYAAVGGTLLAEADLRREVEDVIDVARALWTSWEPDAVIRDVESGRFLDADRVHHVNFVGARFSVVGPLITPRPPQGEVVVIGADTLGVTSRLDVALIDAPSLDELSSRAAVAREAGASLVFADVRDPGALRPDELEGVVDGVRLHPSSSDDLAAAVEALGPLPPVAATLRETLGV